ncbi:MAG: class B sortase [Solibacillus sp.]|uniref:class B sortase n=1 Tax=Solibacillus sp. TaxID=1909654 RepID=UPI003314806F
MRKWLRLFSVVVMIVCAMQLIQYVWSYWQVNEGLEEAQKTVLENDITALQRQNDEIIGWLSLENSRLNNPVLQTTNNEFYLTHNYLREKSRGGSIFVDFRNERMNDRHTIFYGHVLRNGTMFGELAKFADQQYADEHPVFHFETNNRKYKLEVFAAYETTTDYYYIETDFTDESYKQFLQEISIRSVIQMPVDVTENDKIVTLSTCTTSQDETERFVVHAKVIEQ